MVVTVTKRTKKKNCAVCPLSLLHDWTTQSSNSFQEEDVPTDTAGRDTSFMFSIRFMILCLAFIMVEKARARGEEVKSCRCCELEDVKASHTLRGAGEGGTQGEGSAEEARGL